MEETGGAQEVFIKQEEETVSTKEKITTRAQELVDELNVKRSKDASLLNDIKKDLDQQTTKSCNFLEKSLHNVYVQNSEQMENKISELFKILDRISQLEEELKEFKNSLNTLYQDVACIE